MRKQDGDRIVRDVGRRVAELRCDLGLTQAEFAEALGIATNTLQRIEIGRQNLTIRTLVRLSDQLGAPVAALFEAPRSREVRKGRPPRATSPAG